MIARSPERRRTAAFPLAAGLLLSACGSPRHEAAAELERLHEAMQRHATRHGRYPETLDAGRQASATNLPHEARKGVALRLVRATADGYQARARRKSWICYLRVSPGRAARPECTPVSPSLRDEPETAAQPAGGFDQVLPLPGAPRSDPASVDSGGAS